MRKRSGQLLVLVLAATVALLVLLGRHHAEGEPMDERGPVEAESSGDESAVLVPLERDARSEEPVATAPEDEPEIPASPTRDERPPLACRVVRAGVGVPGCEVVLLHRKEIVHQDVTDAEGRFVLPRLDHMGSHNLEIRTERATLRAKGLARHQKFNGREVRIFHLGHATAEVTVFGQGGEPQAGARVAITVRPRALNVRYSCAATTDTSGRVTFEDLPPGSLSVSGQCLPPNSRQAKVPGGPVTVPIELGPAPDGVPLRVRVLAPDGSIVRSHIQVNCVALDSPARERVTADRTSYPDGHHEVRLAPGRYSISTYPELPGPPLETEHTEGAPPIELHADGAVIRGELGGHQPRYEGPMSLLARTSLSVALYEPGASKPTFTTQLRDAGTFEFLGVTPGRYVLSGTRGRLDPKMTEVEVVITSPREVIAVEGLALVE